MKMKVISLQSKLKPVLWLFAVALLAGLLSISIFVKTLDCEDLLLVVPDSSNSSQINAKQLEEINGDSFLLTYEILSKESLRAIHANYDITVRKTNYTYPFIMNYRLINGSFFTEEDQKEKKKVAILNQTAAYAMFGNIDICGRKVNINQEEFTVLGVVQDSDDKAHKDNKDQEDDERGNVYIPAACSGENPASFIIQLSGDLTESIAKNEYKGIIVAENEYVTISFKTITEFVYGLSIIGIKIAVISVLLLIFKKNQDRLRESVKNLRKLSRGFYIRELFRHYPQKIWKAAGQIIVMLLMTFLILNLVFSFIEDYIQWNDSVSFLTYEDSSAAGQFASSLKYAVTQSIVLLIGVFIDMVALLLLYWNKHTVTL